MIGLNENCYQLAARPIIANAKRKSTFNWKWFSLIDILHESPKSIELEQVISYYFTKPCILHVHCEKGWDAMLKQFFSYYKPHKRLFIIDFSSAVFVALLELVFPLAVQGFIDILLPTENWSRIVTVSILLLAVYLFSTFLQYIVSYLGHKLGINI